MQDVFELGAALSVSSALSALLAGTVAAVAWLAPRTRERPGPGGAGPAAAVAVAALALLAADELLALHDRLDPSASGIGAVAYALVLSVAVAAVTLALAPPPRAARPWLGAGALAWAASVPVVALDPEPGTALRAVEELLQMAGAVALVVAGLVALRDHGAPRDGERDGWTIAFEIIARADLRRVAIAIAAVIALFGLAGTLVIAGWDTRALDLNDERTLPAYFSAALLLLAAVLSLALREAGRDQGLHPVLLAGLAVFFAVLGADEVAAVHERLQYRTGVPGQLFLLPLVALAGVALLQILRRITRPPARLLLVGGVATWGVAQLVDVLHQPDGGALDYLVVPEETGEMVGSALLAIGVLAGVRALLADRIVQSSISARFEA